MCRSTTIATRALWRPHRLLQLGRAVPGLHRSAPSPCGSEPIYLSTFTGRPPDEPSVLGEALNEVFIPLLIQQFPEIVDFWLPPEGCSYRIARGQHEEGLSRPRQARDDAASGRSCASSCTPKWVIVVDDDIDARDWKDVMWAISTRMDPARDITLVENTPIDYLDFASPGVAASAARSASTPPTNGRPRPSASGARKIRMALVTSSTPSRSAGRSSGPARQRQGAIWK